MKTRMMKLIACVAVCVVVAGCESEKKTLQSENRYLKGQVQSEKAKTSLWKSVTLGLGIGLSVGFGLVMFLGGGKKAGPPSSGPSPSRGPVQPPPVTPDPVPASSAPNGSPEPKPELPPAVPIQNGVNPSLNGNGKRDGIGYRQGAGKKHKNHGRHKNHGKQNNGKHQKKGQQTPPQVKEVKGEAEGKDVNGHPVSFLRVQLDIRNGQAISAPMTAREFKNKSGTSPQALQNSKAARRRQKRQQRAQQQRLIAMKKI